MLTARWSSGVGLLLCSICVTSRCKLHLCQSVCQSEKLLCCSAISPLVILVIFLNTRPHSVYTHDTFHSIVVLIIQAAGLITSLCDMPPNAAGLCFSKLSSFDLHFILHLCTPLQHKPVDPRFFAATSDLV